jgi:hypothetical protein
LATYGEVIEVLRNRLGITSVRELERKESEVITRVASAVRFEFGLTA